MIGDTAATMVLPAHDHLRSTLETWIPRGSEVALADVPVHRNAGDLFILAVTTQLLADLNCRIVHRTGVRDYRVSRARRHVGRDTVIVGLGGGNLGDLYPRYQALREQIVADFPANRIVILPQTVHFTDARARERAARRLSRHRDLRIAVRDRASLEIALRFTPHVELLPDLVHGLGVRWYPRPGIAAASSPARPSPGGTLFLMRRDREGAARWPATRSAAVTGTEPSGGRSLDWRDIFPGFSLRLAVAAMLMPAAPDPCAARLHAWWSGYARELLTRGLARMAGASRIATDRLHGAILARLAGRPVTLFDNSYGKVTAYYEAWWQDDPAVELVRRR